MPESAADRAVPAPAGGAVRREFLGWDGPLLARAADWLLARHGADLSAVTVALPGSQAARVLHELLVDRGGDGFRPPACVTTGELSDRLVTRERPWAARTLRTVVWHAAVRALDARDKKRLIRDGGKSWDDEAWIATAGQLRTLHGTLAAEGLDFAAVAKHDALAELPGERARWEALARAQDAYRERLTELGWDDPHEARRAAIEAGRVSADGPVVLVGVVELNRILQRALEQVAAAPTALVFAPPDEESSFDAWGCPTEAAWTDRPLPLADEQWIVADRPPDQAAAALAAVAALDGRHPVEEITLGVLDDEVAPFLRRAFAPHDTPVRTAAGEPFETSEPGRLLQALHAYLHQGRFRDLAALVRHPAVEPLIADAPGLLRKLDQAERKHLLVRASGPWPEKAKWQWLRGVEERLADFLGDFLGDPDGNKPRPLAVAGDAIAGVFARAYGRRQLDFEDPADRRLLAALNCVRKALEEFGALPATLSDQTPVGGAEAVAWLLARLRGERLTAAPDPTAIEGLGWLELPLDPAPVLVLTGFNEGRLPDSERGDAFLPDHLRVALGIGHCARRIARDAYWLAALQASRETFVALSGRRTLQGDPLTPSRFAFHVADADLPARLKRVVDAPTAALPGETARDGPPRELPRASEKPPLESMRVTDFRAYLDSPYLYYLQRVLKLETVAAPPNELDPLLFGTLTHDVLEEFGKSDQKDATEAALIAGFLDAALDRCVNDCFGTRPPAAVRLQHEHLRHRLHGFARWQAERRREGWKIEYSEWAPKDGGVPFEVDGQEIQLRGRIDRIDRHEATGAWAILDYKTGDKSKDPDKAHRTRGAWTKDLQLPLYRELAAPLDLQGPVQYGYIGLEADPDAIRARMATNWTEDDLDEAVAAAKEIVRCIRRGEFYELGRREPDEPVFQAILGLGLLAPGGAEEDDDE